MLPLKSCLNSFKLIIKLNQTTRRKKVATVYHLSLQEIIRCNSCLNIDFMYDIYRICVWCAWKIQNRRNNNIQWPVHAVHESEDQRAFSSRVFIEKRRQKYRKKIESILKEEKNFNRGGNSVCYYMAWERASKSKKKKTTRQSSIQFSTSFLFDLSHFLFCIYTYIQQLSSSRCAQ